MPIAALQTYTGTPVPLARHPRERNANSAQTGQRGPCREERTFPPNLQGIMLKKEIPLPLTPPPRPGRWNRGGRGKCSVRNCRSNAERSAATVRDVWVVAARTVFDWAVERKHTKQNPFKTVSVSVPRKKDNRADKTFNSDEVKTILRASLAITDTTKARAATRRWVPWLCAYTGARVFRGDYAASRSRRW